MLYPWEPYLISHSSDQSFIGHIVVAFVFGLFCAACFFFFFFFFFFFKDCLTPTIFEVDLPVK